MICRRRAALVNPWMYVLTGLFVLMYALPMLA